MSLDGALQTLGLPHDERGEHREDDTEPDEEKRQPPVEVERQRQEDEQRHERRQVLAEEREPEPPDRIGAGEHHLQQAARVRSAVVAERQLQDVLEVVGEDGVPAAVREPVGMERGEGAADDREQAEADPRAEQWEQARPRRRRVRRLRVHQRVEDVLLVSARAGDGRQRHRDGGACGP